MLAMGVNYCRGGRPSKDQAIGLIHEALRSGITMFDTSDCYCTNASDLHYGERLLAQALNSFPGDISKVKVCTKCGMTRYGDGRMSKSWASANYKPATLQAAIRASHEALGGQRAIDLWMFHHTDAYDTKNTAPFREALRAVKELVDEGLLVAVGLCNCSTAHVEIAGQILADVAVIQNHFSLWDRKAELPPTRKARPVAKTNKNDLLPLCDERGIAFMPHGALGGHPAREMRVNLSEDFRPVAKIAAEKGCSPQVVVLAWMRHKYPNTLIALAGARTIDHVQELATIPNIRLTQAEFDTVDACKKNCNK